jgi:hypothetical protein
MIYYTKDKTYSLGWLIFICFYIIRFFKTRKKHKNKTFNNVKRHEFLFFEQININIQERIKEYFTRFFCLLHLCDLEMKCDYITFKLVNQKNRFEMGRLKSVNRKGIKNIQMVQSYFLFYI